MGVSFGRIIIMRMGAAKLVKPVGWYLLQGSGEESTGGMLQRLENDKSKTGVEELREREYYVETTGTAISTR